MFIIYLQLTDDEPAKPYSTKTKSQTTYVTRTKTGAVTPRSHAKQPQYIDLDEYEPPPVKYNKPSPSGRGRPSKAQMAATAAIPPPPVVSTPGRRGRPSKAQLAAATGATPTPVPAGSTQKPPSKSTPKSAPKSTPKSASRSVSKSTPKSQPKQPPGPFVDLNMECQEEPLSRAQVIILVLLQIICFGYY